MQKFTLIPTSQTLQSSLSLLLDNDLTAISQSAGTAFPTTNLTVGMPCLRTDQMKVYTLKAIEPAVEWVETSDLNATSWNSANHGVGSGMNADMVDGIHAATAAAPNVLLALNSASKLPASITGDAATAGGYKPSNVSGGIPISNGTRTVNLNADMVDGYHAGNSASQVPVSNGQVNTNLNADMLDGLHAESFVRSVSGVTPDANGNVALNVDQSGRVAKAGDTMTGRLTGPGFTATQDVTVENAAPGVILKDTSSATSRRLQHDNNLMGFLKVDGSWDFYSDNTGQVWSGAYGWLHSYFFNSVANCGSGAGGTPGYTYVQFLGTLAVNCYGSGSVIGGQRHELVDEGGVIRLRTVNYLTNNCNCNCSTDSS